MKKVDMSGKSAELYRLKGKIGNPTQGMNAFL
jgi:hypothetical protein